MASPPAPFDALRAPPPYGWRGGLTREPTWRRARPTGVQPHDWVDTAGVHALLRAAGLPREELLHMGCPENWLSPSVGPWLDALQVGPLLGRIVLDHREEVWHGGLKQYVCACELGADVLRYWFHEPPRGRRVHAV